MSDEPEQPPKIPPGATGGEPLPPDLQARADKIIEFLKSTWGDPAPPCPYCRRTTWVPDPVPTLLPRAAPDQGPVPVFLVWCATCGHELCIAVAVTGLWEETFPVEPTGPSGDQE